MAKRTSQRVPGRDSTLCQEASLKQEARIGLPILPRSPTPGQSGSKIAHPCRDSQLMETHVTGTSMLCPIPSAGPALSNLLHMLCGPHQEVSLPSNACQWEGQQEIWWREEAEIMISPAPSLPGCCGLAGLAPVKQHFHTAALPLPPLSFQVE